MIKGEPKTTDVYKVNIKVLCVCSKGLYAYTNTAYRRTDKVKVDKGSEGGGEGGGEGGWQKKVAERKKTDVARDLCHPNKYATVW